MRYSLISNARVWLVLALFHAARLAVVDAAAVLAHDQNVGALDHVLSIGRSLEQGRPGARRPQGVVDLELDPQAGQPIALGDRAVDADVVPFRPADRADQYRVGLPRFLEHLIRAVGAMPVPGGAAEQIFLDLDGDAGLAGHVPQDRKAFGDDLRADVVSAEGEDVEFLLHVAAVLLSRID